MVIWRAYVGRYREARELGERLVVAAAGGDEGLTFAEMEADAKNRVSHRALAIAERQKVSGKELLASYVVGVEVACRIGNLLVSHFRDGADYWHITNTCGVLGSASAAGPPEAGSSWRR